jgi:hypothetical protein
VRRRPHGQWMFRECPIIVYNNRPARPSPQHLSGRWVIPGPTVQPHPFAFLTSDDPEAVPFDFVQPNRAGRRTRGAGWEARRNKARRQGTHTQRRHLVALSRGARCLSRVRSYLLPVTQELGLGRFQARRAPARRNAQHGVDVHRDGPEPPQLGPAMPVFIDAPHVAAILNDYVVEPGAIGRG